MHYHFDPFTLSSQILASILLIISIIILFYHLYRLYVASNPSESNENAEIPMKEPIDSDVQLATGSNTSIKYQSCDSVTALRNESQQTTKNKTKQKQRCTIGTTFCHMIKDIFDSESQFRAVLKPQSIRFSVYLCLATIFVCARSVLWAFWPVAYFDGVKYQCVFTVYMFAKAIHRWIMYWLLLSKVHLIFDRTKYRISKKALKFYKIVLTILSITVYLVLVVPLWIYGSSFYLYPKPRIMGFFGWFILIEFLPSVFCCWIFIKRIYLHTSSSKKITYANTNRKSVSNSQQKDVVKCNIPVDADDKKMEKQKKDNDASDVESLIPKTLILTLFIVIFTVAFSIIAVFIPDIRLTNLVNDPLQGVGICICVLLMYKSHLKTYTLLCFCYHKRIKACLTV